MDENKKHYTAVQVLLAIEAHVALVGNESPYVQHLIDVWKGTSAPEPWAVELINIASKKIRAQIRESDPRKN